MKSASIYTQGLSSNMWRTGLDPRFSVLNKTSKTKVSNNIDLEPDIINDEQSVEQNSEKLDFVKVMNEIGIQTSNR
jgi:hypothetical protein